MARYFFDTTDNGRLTVDDGGTELATHDDVREQAIKVLPLMALDALPDGDTHEFRVEVRDEERHQLFRVTLTLRSDWLS
jgi:uncharacterized protein DUF6894